MKLVHLADQRFQAALSKLIAQPVPLRAAFKLKGIAAKVQEEVRKYEEVRHSALQQYGDKGEDGQLIVGDNNAVKFSKENLELFVKELNALGEMDISIGSISISELGDNALLTGEDVLALDGLLLE